MRQLVVALVRRAHGLRGEVLVEPLTGDSGDIFVPGRELAVLGEGTGDRLIVETVRVHKGGHLLRFRGIEDRSAAEALRGAELAVEEGELRELEDEEFFVHDLVGCRVGLVDGTDLGIVGSVYEVGEQVLLGVSVDEREILIPFGRQVVEDVDRETGRIVIDPPPGLLEV